MGNSITYDYKSFTLTNGQSDYDIKANISALFDNITVAKRIVIKTNKTISFKFNNTILPVITIDVSKNESPYQAPENFLDIVNIFMSNSSGDDAVVSIMLV